VKQVEGVRFRDLFERLPKDRAADGGSVPELDIILKLQIRID